MSNTYKMTSAKGEVRRERSLTTFHYSGDVYFDLDGFHFLSDNSSRGPRRDWDFEGHARNAAERLVIESYGSPVLVVDETQGDLFVGIYGIKSCHQCSGSGTTGYPERTECDWCYGLGRVSKSYKRGNDDRYGSPIYNEHEREVVREWLALEESHRNLEKANRMRAEARRR
jgi:hypothetical protein